MGCLCGQVGGGGGGGGGTHACMPADKAACLPPTLHLMLYEEESP